jgi:peptide/nickel transport system ATP-binding protein
MFDKTPLMELSDVSRNFIIKKNFFEKNKVLYAVRDVSLKIERGDVLAIVGESGSGKTTLAKMLMNVLTPSSGQILYEGKPNDKRTVAERTRNLQAVFQDPYSSLNPRKTIGNIISLPLRIHEKNNSNVLYDKTLKIMDKVGLPARLYHSYPNQLSGGQRQRVSIARALILKPEIVICDELTSALDVSVQSQILNLLIDMKNEFKLTYVIITHNLAVVENIANKVAVMYLGKIVEMADCDKIFKSPRHPYTQALLGSILSPNSDLGIPRIELGVNFPDATNLPDGCSFHPRCSLAKSICNKIEPKDEFFGKDFVQCHNYETNR